MTENNSCCGSSNSSNNETHAHDEHRQSVRKAYAEVANANNAGDATGIESSCCGVSDDGAINTLISTRLGYEQEDLDKVPSGADMGLGCGNPKAIASLKPGEVVVDLGAGGGFDCFLAAHEVGDKGHVIGIDMTPDMLAKARVARDQAGLSQVDFREGYFEKLPVD
ncbi:MAG: methyltransferase domain-containing protein, partial [Gammaproteobacteria bacterium]|nr:methyltransferase domain-containing protein [Gammaproteobacteria bacterium]